MDETYIEVKLSGLLLPSPSTNSETLDFMLSEFFGGGLLGMRQELRNFSLGAIGVRLSPTGGQSDKSGANLRRAARR